MEFKGLCFVVGLICILNQGTGYRIRRCNEPTNDNTAELITTNAEDSNLSVPTDNDKKWSFTIPIDFDSLQNLSTSVQDAFREARIELEQFTCLQLKTRDLEKDTDFIYFTKDKDDECFAENVGKIRGKNIINLGNICNDSGIILQEIMHVLGFEHEHQRPDRDHFVTVNYDNIPDPPEIRKDFNPVNKILYNLSLPYDYNSITHFSENYRSINDKATITPILSNVTFQTHYNRHLSDLDKFKINMVYQCYVKYPHLFNPQSDTNAELKSFSNEIIADNYI